ncbi:MAG: PilN domain-containing protein [Armatimonadota bacterium]
MPVINLIEQELHHRQRLQRRIRLLGLIWFGLIALTALGWGALMLYAGYLQLESGRMQEEIVRLTPTVRAVQQTQLQLNQLQPQIQTLQTARKETGRWRQLLHHLSRHTPPTCYLTSVEFGKRADPKKPMEVVIKGIATNQQAVGDFMLHLNQHANLENVRLDYTQGRALDNEADTVEFQITAQVKGTAMPQTASGGGARGS